jgi:hypothetical protein
MVPKNNIKIIGNYECIKYPENFSGIIESFLERFPIFDNEFYLEWKK